MRRLFLLRHSKAERAELGESDRNRALTERGRKDAGTIGAYMARHAMTPDQVLVSTAARSQETWKYAASAFRPVPAVQPVDRLYDATPRTIFNVIAEMPAAAALGVLVVGHNPGLHELAVLLIASGEIEARERLREKLPTSGLIVIDFVFDDWAKLHPHSGRLERFVSPKSIEAATN